MAKTLDHDHICISEILRDESLGHDVRVESLPRKVAGGYVVDVRKVDPPCVRYCAVVDNLRRDGEVHAGKAPVLFTVRIDYSKGDWFDTAQPGIVEPMQRLRQEDGARDEAWKGFAQEGTKLVLCRGGRIWLVTVTARGGRDELDRVVLDTCPMVRMVPHLECQCGTPGIAQCDRHGPTE